MRDSYKKNPQKNRQHTKNSKHIESNFNKTQKNYKPTMNKIKKQRKRKLTLKQTLN